MRSCRRHERRREQSCLRSYILKASEQQHTAGQTLWTAPESIEAAFCSAAASGLDLIEMPGFMHGTLVLISQQHYLLRAGKKQHTAETLLAPRRNTSMLPAPGTTSDRKARSRTLQLHVKGQRAAAHHRSSIMERAQEWSRYILQSSCQELYYFICGRSVTWTNLMNASNPRKGQGRIVRQPDKPHPAAGSQAIQHHNHRTADGVH